jgi:hypothetical protein
MENELSVSASRSRRRNAVGLNAVWSKRQAGCYGIFSGGLDRRRSACLRERMVLADGWFRSL